MKTVRADWLLLIFVIFTGCAGSEKRQRTEFQPDKPVFTHVARFFDNERAHRREPSPAITLACHPSMMTNTNPYELTNAWMLGDTLVLRVSYTGGCKKHSFMLCTKNAFFDSYPVQVPVFLYHDAQADPCTAEVRQELTFDLDPLKKRYRDFYHEDSGTMMLRILHYPQLVRYEWRSLSRLF